MKLLQFMVTGDLFNIAGPLFHGEYEMQDPKSPDEV